MSLLNDMLRDLSQDVARPSSQNLEHNLAAHSHAQEEQRELFSQSSAAKPLPRSLLPSVVVFVVVLLGIFGWRYFSDEKPTVSTTTEMVSVPEQVQSEKIDALPENTGAAATIIASPELDERLAALESAVTTLTNVLTSSEQTTAEQTNVEQKKEVGSLHSDSSMKSVAAEVASVEKPLDEKTADQKSIDQESGAETAESVSINEPFAAIAENNTPSEPQGDPSLFIAPNPAWKDQQLALQARELFQAGQEEQSIARLQDFIASHPAAQESTRLLLDIFCEQENSTAAQQVLTQSSFLAVATKNYYAAKIRLIEGNLEEAVALLEASLVEAENDENYRALLAGLYQRSGMNQEAASHYRRLLSVFGEKPAYWLGFALAQDALNQSQLALQAYQRVNQYSDLQPQVRQYVEQRLVALQQ
jgi:MSHA biogenesis protein MshN